MQGEGMKGSDIDSLVSDVNEYEERDRRASGDDAAAVANVTRTLIGTVEHFFSKVGVMAITLDGPLRVGDTIEIVKDGERIRRTVESMQIDRKDVTEAGAGDDVGIKVDVAVEEGSTVYVVEEE